ncbi:hypothetical protein B0O99DRAFT_664128 [Bisporella sp. PMI_857]|nr:hypothetical protein B0O99DRAFT_664128 [Bisporella sp. PMI_857]
MDHPKHVIKSLTEGSPVEQKQTLERYFLPDASFTHPFCRTPRFSRTHVPFLGDIDSRWVIWMIYRWYKILSPKVVLEVQSNVKSPPYLEITPLSNPNNGKYYIVSQEDLYQTNEFVKFVCLGGVTIIYFWQISATIVCAIGSLLFFRVIRAQQWNANRMNRIEKNL